MSGHIIPWDATADAVHAPEVVLRAGIALVRRRDIEAAYSRVPKRRAPRTIEVEARDACAQ